MSLPTIIKDYARAGNGHYVYALEIDPSAADSWTTKRFSEAAIEIAGDEFNDAIADGFNRVAQSTRIIQTGDIGTAPALTFTLINKDKLHEELMSDRIVNRKATLKLTAISSNRILNSSFEKNNGLGDFEDWSEHSSGLGGTIAVVSSGAYDEDDCVQILSTNGTEGSHIRQSGIEWKVGEELFFSLYAKTTTGGGSPVYITIKDDTLGAYWTGSSWSIGTRVMLDLGDASTSWQRFSYSGFGWHDAMLYGGATNPRSDRTITFEIWCEPGNHIYVDAVQLEQHALTNYHHNRYELTDDDCQVVFTGIIRRPKWTTSQLSFQLEAYQANTHRKIPTTIVGADIVSGWKVPKESNGEPFPMTYGDFIANEHTVYDSDNPELCEFARGILANVDPNHSSRIVVYFDKPGLDLHHPSLSYGEYRLYHFHKEDKRYYEQSKITNPAWYGADSDFADELSTEARWRSATNANYAEQEKLLLMAYLRCKNIYWAEYAGITNINGPCDADISTYMQCTDVTYAPSTGSYIIAIFPFDPEKTLVSSAFSSGGPGMIFLIGDFGLVSGTGTADFDVALTVHNDWGFLCDYTSVLSAVSAGTYFRNTPIKRTGGDPATNKYLTECQIDVKQSAASAWDAFCNKACPDLAIRYSIDLGGMTSPIFRVYEMGLVIFTLYPLEEANYASQCYGRRFGTTWNGRKRATDLVESAPEVIESILREELGAVDADIDMTAFDAADSARSEAAAGQVHELKKSTDVIKQLCKEFGLLYYTNTDGKHSLMSLDYNSSAARTLVMKDFIDPYKKLNVSQTPRESVINSVKVFYDKNQFTGNYSKYSFCNRSGRSGSIPASYQTKCSTSYAELGNIEQHYEIHCEWIKTEASAEALIKWLIDWNYLQRYIVDGDVFLDHYDLELGSVLALDLPPLLPSSVTTDSRFLLIDKKLNRKSRKLTVRFLEIKDPS